VLIYANKRVHITSIVKLTRVECVLIPIVLRLLLSIIVILLDQVGYVFVSVCWFLCLLANLVKKNYELNIFDRIRPQNKKYLIRIWVDATLSIFNSDFHKIDNSRRYSY